MSDYGSQGQHARIVDGVIVAIGHYPKYEVADGIRYDLRDPATRAARGWVEVVETPRPADTDTATWDGGAELVDGVPTRTWSPRAWLPGELGGSLRAIKAQSMSAVSVPKLAATVQALVDALLPPQPARRGQP